MQEKTTLLSYEAAADRLGVSLVTFRRYAAAGKIPVIRFSHRNVKVPEAALEQALAAMISGGSLPEKAV
jgi:excisionase family DNA binding protein